MSSPTLWWFTAEVPPQVAPERRLARIREGLLSTWAAEFATEDAYIAHLEANWSAITTAAFAKKDIYDALIGRINLRFEPAALATTLLRPSGRAPTRSATRASWEHYLNRTECGPLGTELLRATLQDVFRVPEVPLLGDLATAEIEVEPEWKLPRRRRSRYS